MTWLRKWHNSLLCIPVYRHAAAASSWFTIMGKTHQRPIVSSLEGDNLCEMLEKGLERSTATNMPPPIKNGGKHVTCYICNITFIMYNLKTLGTVHTCHIISYYCAWQWCKNGGDTKPARGLSPADNTSYGLHHEGTLLRPTAVRQARPLTANQLFQKCSGSFQALKLWNQQ